MTSFKASMLVALPLYHLLILLLVLTSFQHATKLVLADEKLIEQQCHNAEVPATCIQCVNSDPTAIKADKVGIAAIVINCLSDNVETLAKNMSSMASTVQDKSLKSMFNECTKGFLEARRDLSTAMKELKKKNYDQTNLRVRKAVTPELDCKNNVVDKIKLAVLQLPDDVLYTMRVYEELTNAAMRIIDRF
ncbi:Pectinesterase inhibitor [Corchorus capsularis]|uniref:Pectinesterase inhibitor n=1 Tax=Corchorus capsularis TaxID=210143 RepID=A0A1R3J0K4_COCAP|nr:Pectinesterase inhibitor [Corchorus capsularis]